VVLLVVDGSERAGGGDRFIAELLVDTTTPIVLGLNKIDNRNPDQWVDRIQGSYQELAGEQNWAMAEFSALTGEGIAALQETLIERPERFIMGELIREQILLLTKEEVPHSVAVTIDRVQEDAKITRVLATIYVERDSQKGILIGRGGSMLKTIGSEARSEMQKLISGKVYLELFVKVQPKWRHSRLRLAELGYRAE
jgi:GTPase